MSLRATIRSEAISVFRLLSRGIYPFIALRAGSEHSRRAPRNDSPSVNAPSFYIIGIIFPDG